MFKFTIAILLLLLLPFPIIIKFIYLKDKKIFYLYFFKINLNNKSFKKKNKDTSEPQKNISYKKIPLFLKKINKLYLIRHFNLMISFGLGDAYNTAMLYGFICSLENFLYVLFKNYFNIKYFNLKLAPNLNKKTFKLKLSSIIFINFAEIIFIIVFAKYYLKSSSKSYKNKVIKEDF